LLKGSKESGRFAAVDTLEGIQPLKKDFQFLYSADDTIHLLDRETLEEVELPEDSIIGISNHFMFIKRTIKRNVGGKKLVGLLHDEMDVKVLMDETSNTPLAIQIPETGSFLVESTDPSPSSVSNEGKGTRFKKAQLANGMTITVPEFIQTGEFITVHLESWSYKERNKSFTA
jgi:elongation factor P